MRIHRSLLKKIADNNFQFVLEHIDSKVIQKAPLASVNADLKDLTVAI
jgi:hypothetical protein